MKNLAKNLGLVMLLVSSFAGVANAIIVNAPYHRRGTFQGHYCPLSGWICWHRILDGAVSYDLCGEDLGNLDISVVSDSMVRVIFHCDFGVEGGDNDIVPVDEPATLDAAVAAALGYDAVTLLAGTYPVDYTNHPFGEAMIDAVVGNPVPGEVAAWGTVKSSYR